MVLKPSLSHGFTSCHRSSRVFLGARHLAFFFGFGGGATSGILIPPLPRAGIPLTTPCAPCPNIFNLPIPSSHVAGRRPSREAIYLRDGGICGICRHPVPLWEASVDHLAPRATFRPRLPHLGHDPTGIPALLRLAHRSCNTRRGTLAPHFRDILWHLVSPIDEPVMRAVISHYAGWWLRLGCPIDFRPFLRGESPLPPLILPMLDTIPPAIATPS